MEEPRKDESTQQISSMLVKTHVKLRFLNAAKNLGPLSLRDWILQACHEKCDRQGVRY